LQAFDISDGTLLYTITGLPYIGANFRNSVTVKDGFVYFGGGNNRGFTKADVYTGVVVWSRNIAATPFVGNTYYTNSVILTCGSDEVVYLTTDAGEVYALDAATGANYGGWAVNPVMVDGLPYSGISSNGTDVVYVSTDGSYDTGNATFYAIDACTGAINWTLGEGTLAGAALSGLADPGEFFRAGAAVDLDGSIYFQTAFNNTAGAPSGGRYRVDPSGGITWAKGGKYTGFCYPVIDAGNVIFSGLRAWTSENNSTVGVKKTSGGQAWESDIFFDGSAWVEGALSCEEGARDIYYQGTRDWQFLAVNADNGTVEFEYNYANLGSERGMGIAIDPTHVVMTNRQGELYVFTEQVDRPRLRIMKFDELAAVPFFSPPSYIVTFEDVFINNGCANLTGNLTVDENPSAAYAWTVNPERISRMQAVADGMVSATYEDMAGELVKSQPVPSSSLDADFAESPYAKDTYSNMGAYGPPAWLNGVAISTFDLAPGETFDVIYDVNGPLVTRGPQRAYVSINSNDQYFINSPDAPVIQLGVLGGCLESNDALTFGTTEQNVAPVLNTGEIGSQEVTLFSIDGADNRYWQGALFYAADQHRLAWTSESWHASDPANFWNSLLPDPNCFDQCEPYVTPDPVLLGAMSHDGGLTYTDVEGYASVVAYIDSVINFDCYGTGWNWANVECPFDNALTLGIRVREYMYGAIAEPALNNVVIYKYVITNRNPDPLPGVYVGAFNDFDLDGTLNGFDLFRFDAAHSISWGSPCSPAYDFTDGVVYGMGKVPMDVDPMIGTRTLDANQAMWATNNVALDSMYYWMTTQPGQTAQAGIDMNFPCDPLSETDDRDAWHSFIGHDFAGNETYTFGSYMLGFEHADVTDDQFFFDLAVMVNQFCGFGRGDIDDNGAINLADVVALWNMLHAGGPGPLFEHLADVDASGAVDNADVLYLANYYFCLGPAPVGDWVLPDICP
jgi:outer membrane protein assembly factor BamB